MARMTREEKIKQAREINEMRRRARMRSGGRRGPGGPPGMPADKAVDFKGTMKHLVAFLGGYRAGIVIVWIFAIAGTAFNIVGPKILGTATTELFSGLMNKIQGIGTIDFGAIGRILLITIAIYLASSLCMFIQGYTMAWITQKVSYGLREQISDKIHRLPLKYFETETTGDILSRITNDVDTLGMGLNQSLTQLITSVTTLIGVLIMMLSISPVMTLITVLIVPLSLICISLIISKSQKYFIAQQRYLGEVNGQVEEIYSGHNVIKAFNRDGKAVEEFNENNDKLYKSAVNSQFLSGILMPLMRFIGNLGYVGVAVSGAMLAIKGRITVGDIQAFIQYVQNFTQPIQQLAQVSNQLQSMVAAAERVFEFLNEEEEPQTGTGETLADGVKGSVRFEHVRFGYEEDKIIIRDFSASVEPGQTVAIVGPTGAGKTTLVKLLMRFYDLNGGRILVDGKDISEYARGDLRDCFDMVLQDTWLFKGTIRENIRYGRLEASDEEVEAAAKAAYADDFIRTLPGGYDMVLNEDATNISQGQRQLLTIARAILSDNPILILDEATSSVDTRTEQMIQDAMQRLMKGRTSFVIAHRLSTIREADTILVINDGDIVEKGTHSELLAKGGFYAGMYNSQFEE